MADGFGAAKGDKISEQRKFKRTQAWKKCFVLCCLALVLCMAVLWICFNFEVNLVAVLLVKVWHFLSNKLFMFVLISVIVIVLVVMSGSLCPSNGHEDLYDEFVRRNQAARKDYAVAVNETVAASEAMPAEELQRRSDEKLEVSAKKNLQTVKSFAGTAKPRGRKMRRSESAEMKPRKEAVVSNSLTVMEVVSNEEAMPAEELQRRFDEFIAKFKGHIRQENSSSY